MSLADLLTAKNSGAHDRYRPLTQIKDYYGWHMYLKEGHTNDKASLPRRFAEACADFPPAFNRFFLESWTDPHTFFFKRSVTLQCTFARCCC